jgi:thymidylate kinase
MTPHSTCRPAEVRGLWIAFFGPDGVGKSAVIEQVKDQLGPVFTSVAQFHFRPMFLRRGLSRAPVTEPHGQVPRTLLVSMAKLAYWLLDCWYGYLLATRSVRRRGGLVIFDRYYPDILVDPLRYRLPPKGRRFAKWLVSLAPRPDLCILLDARAEVVQRRKREVSLGESQRQRFAYLAMFQFMRDKLLVNADGPTLEVAQRVSTALLLVLEKPSSQAQERGILFADN